MLKQMSDDSSGCLRGKMIGMYGLLIAGNSAAWLWALAEFHDRPVLLGLAVLSYSFGLRHAFDADHIAVIDNVTRKLMQQGRRPIAAGLFFSLGHSTVVVGLAVAIALGATALRGNFDVVRMIGATIGTSISVLFLFAIAAVNSVVLVQVYRTFRSVRRGGQLAGADIETTLCQGGLLGRLLLPAFRMNERSWHMYPLGILFGLGFDTATEVGLLGISAAQAGQGLSIWTILVFPALFTAGMSLLDTADSSIMVSAYGWAFVKPIRKLYYNLTVTFVSVMAAVLIGGIEAIGLSANKLPSQGPFWRLLDRLAGNLSFLGFGIVAFFIVSWIASFLFYGAKSYDLIDTSATRC